MLVEYAKVRQRKGEPRRRWFGDEYFDLIIWENEDREILSFHLCYEKSWIEKALAWTHENGFRHLSVDNGEEIGGRHKMSPILVSDGLLDIDSLKNRFVIESQQIEMRISEFILQKLNNYPALDH